MHIAFYVQDEPAPELRWRIVGLLLCLTSAACILWSVYVIAHVISSLTDTYNVSQKLLTWPEFSYYNKTMANILPTEKQVAIVSSLCEGSSICSIERITGVHRDTIMRLGVRIGQGCTALMSEKMRDLPCTRLEMDEIWGFIGKKERRVQPHDDRRLGDVWTFCAIDADTKLVPAFKVGKRDSATANAFVADISNRMRNRVQISTDGLRAYVDAIDQAFGGYVDIPPVVSPQTAVQAAIVQEFRNRAKAN
jgi:IS1 family transposase